MKKTLQCAAALLLLSTLIYQPATAHAQGTAFTYQGRLNDTNGTANGSYDLQFAIYDAAGGGTKQGVGFLTNSPTAVSNGLFTVTLDFGSGVFPGAGRWLEIAVRPSGSSPGAFITLAPRQALTPSPYAITAGNVSGVLSNSSLPANAVFPGVVAASSFTGNGVGVTNVNAATLNGIPSGNFWQLGGNNVGAGQFLGSTNNQPLELRVNNVRGLRLETGGSNSVNVIGGSSGNSVAAGIVGATVAGGGAGNYIGNAYNNRIESSFGYIGGGGSNTIQLNSYFSTIGGGGGNTIQSNADESTISGGYGNTIQRSAYNSTIGGGAANTIQTNSDEAAIGGGYANTIQANSPSSTIGGGDQNTVGHDSQNAVIGGGVQNTIQSNAVDAVIVGGSLNTVQAGGSRSIIGGGRQNTVEATSYGAVLGGFQNRIEHGADGAVLSGGYNNSVYFNSTNASIGGGSGNLVQNNAVYATIPGGLNNSAVSYAFAAGRRAKADTTGAFVWADSQDADFNSTAANQFLVRAAGGVGINTPNPVVPLTVEGSGAYNSIAAAAIAVKNSTASRTWEWHVLDDGRMQIADLTASATRVIIDTTGKVGIGATTLNNKLEVGGSVGATAFNTTSDRSAKENFSAVSASEILAKVAALPITRWNFKQETGTPHIGPMAQDFHAAFGTGTDDRHIATVDADGVALAAIQGLNEKMEAGSQKSESRIQTLETENAELKAQMAELKALLKQLAQQK